MLYVYFCPVDQSKLCGHAWGLWKGTAQAHGHRKGVYCAYFYKLSTADRVEAVINTVQICFDSSLLGFLSLAIYHFLLEYLQNISVIIEHKFYSTEHFSFYLGHRVAISIKLNFPYFIKTKSKV